MAFPQEFLIQPARLHKLSERQQEVFVELFGTGQSRVAIQQKLNISNSSFTSCLTEIYRKFSITDDAGRGKENHLRDYLENQYKLWKPQAEMTSMTVEPDLKAVVEKVRSQIRPLIQERYGKMRMLEVGWVPVDEIYVSLKVLVLELTQAQQEPCKALTALKDHPKAMLLGQPGSGKSTLLRSLAIECIKNQPELEELKHYVPVFLILRNVASRFVKDLKDKEQLVKDKEQLVLVKAIKWELQSWGVTEVEQTTEALLSKGRIFLLLDGLDEVKEQHSEAINDQIQQFCQQYGDNRIIITCRTEHQQYRFDCPITDIKIVDFNSEQVRLFIQNWFSIDRNCELASAPAEQVIGQLEAPENRATAKLAATPLLLNMICVIALGHQGTLLKRRSDLYEECSRVLLTKWDEFEGKQRRQRRSTLSVDEKEDLLSYIAVALFEKNDYIPERKTIECLIRSKLNISRSQAETLLESFETEHGLLVKQDRNYWSFSHHPFQEYFAAREIAESRDPEILQRFVKNVVEKRWREVFLLAVEMLPKEKADELVRLMKREIDGLLVGDEKLQEFLSRLLQKQKELTLADVPYKPVAIKAFYFNLALGHARPADSRTRPFDIDLDLALYRILDRADAFAHTDIDLEHILTHAHTSNHPTIPQSFPIVPIDPNHFNCIDLLSKVLEFELPSTVMHDLQQLKEQLPDASQENRENFKQWWRENGKAWTEKLRAVMIKHRNIGHDWQFSDEQKELLNQYYDANKLLIDCLNLLSDESRDVRAEIEETLLLPIEEIEKRRKQ